jgi:hypothetical protein
VLTVLRHSRSGARLRTWVMSGAVLPEGTLERAALAWPLTAGDPAAPRATGRVGVLGPVGAVTAVLLGGDGREVGRTSLEDGFGVSEAPSTESARFLDAEGRTVGEARAGPMLTWDQTLALELAR